MSTEKSTALELVTEAVRNSWLDGPRWMALFELLREGREREAIEALEEQIGEQRFAVIVAAMSTAKTVIQPDAKGESPLKTKIDRDLPPALAALLAAETVDRPGGVAFEPGVQSPGDTLLPKLERARYRTSKELGRGGFGSVFAAEDVDVGRFVAMKVLNEDAKKRPDIVKRFVTEARITAQLEHPGIVPVYDLGVLPSGEPFYTMRIVEKNSLAAILKSPKLRREYSLARLIAIFVQVCRAVSFAHVRGVVHRDLKPDNILIGDYGEVYVTDWGISLVGPGEPRKHKGPSELTTDGMLLGTPGYMAPEQIGLPHSVDARADIFSLGAVLYELLTGRPPFAGSTAFEALHQTVASKPISPRSLNSATPIALEEICMWCLEYDFEDRPQDLQQLIHEIEAYLEGTKERERQRREAERLIESARQVQSTVEALKKEAESLQEEARAALRGVRPHDDISRKKPAWELQVRAEQVDLELVEAWGQMVSFYSQALARDPSSEGAKSGLAQLYFDRVLEAEAERNPSSRRLFEVLMREYDDGSCAARLRAKAKLSIKCQPEGAEVEARAFVSAHGVYQLGARRVLGRAPLESELQAGTWLLVFSRDGYEPARVPVKLVPGQSYSVEVRLRTRAELGEGFVHIPRGAAIVGGDAHAPNALPPMSRHLEDFAIAKYPVTVAEYVAFLRDLARSDPELAAAYSPAGGRARFSDDDCTTWLPATVLNLVRARHEGEVTPELVRALPICGISWYDALAYARWRAEKDRLPVRLPTELEWEKAARGADGRYFPWGDRFDPTFAKMADSRDHVAIPELVGAFPLDNSPYGVCDLSGGVREWAADVEGEISFEQALNFGESSAEATHQMRILRGGAYTSPSHECRAASRLRMSAMVKRADFGVRLARSLPSSPR